MCWDKNLPIFLVLIILNCFCCKFSLANDCDGGLTAAIFRRLSELIPAKKEWINDRVEVIYFPGRQHTKLRVGDIAYGNECPNDRCTQVSYEALNRLAASSLSTGPQFRFRIKVTRDELRRLQEYIASGRYGNALNCSHSVCKALNKNTGAWVPAPIGVSPLLSAVYLAFSRLIPGSRIVGIDVRKGKNLGSALPTAVVAATGEIFVLTVFVAAPIGLIAYNVVAALEDENENPVSKTSN